MIHDMTPKVELNSLEFKAEETELQKDYSIIPYVQRCVQSYNLNDENEAAVASEIVCNEPHKEGSQTQESESFKYLTGLNSDNLMKFSQQSEIEELYIREMLNKQKNRVLPVLEEHDNGSSKFQININGQRKNKSNWYYSQKTKKIYIKPNEIVNIEVAYKSSLASEKLVIRAMIVFSKFVSEPVVRCLNHSSKDSAIKENMKHSLLRCENSNVSYVGKILGKNIPDRLSVLIPIGKGLNSIGSDLTKQTIALKFTCQNSCIGRRETSVIFYLENMNEDILSQRIVDVKVCSCPKRDMEIDEKNLECPTKRKKHVYQDDDPIPKKIIKNEKKLTKNNAEANNFNIMKCLDGSYQILMKFPDKETATQGIQSAFNMIKYAQKMNNSNLPDRYDSSLIEMHYLLENIQQLP